MSEVISKSSTHIDHLAPPVRYQCVLLNDDYTTTDFVVRVLTLFFNHSAEDAVNVMIKVHQIGRAVCGVYPKDVAESKAYMVKCYSQENEYPLLCITEPLTE